MGAISNNQIYALTSVYITTPDQGTKLLAEGGSVSVDRSTGSSPVKTLQKGYAGESPGSGMTEISVDSAVPAGGFEFDPGKYMSDLLEVKFSVFAANATLQFSGFIISDSYSQSVDGEAKISFKARGSLSTRESGF